MIEWHGPIPPANHHVGRDGSLVRFIVIHTMVGWIQSADIRFKNPADPQHASAHFGVKRDGKIWQWVETDDTAYHSGNYECNLESIGIEHEDGGDYDGIRPDELYTGAGWLVRKLCDIYHVPIVRGTWPDTPGIIAHREVSATACPDALDIDRIVEEAVLRDEFEKFKTDTENTLKAMKDTYNPLYHHVHLLEAEGLKTGEPLIPPFEGAKYSGESADGSQIIWRLIDGTLFDQVKGG